MKINIREDYVELEGYVNAIERNSKPLWSRLGRFIERVCKGAFTKALQRNKDVMLLLNHDRGKVLGSTSMGNLELTEDSIGLHARARVTDGETVEKAKRGELVGWSFGFYDIPDGVEDGVDQDTRLPLRKLRDLDLIEVSVLDTRKTPAYDGTLVYVRDDEPVVYYGEAYIEEPEVIMRSTEPEKNELLIDYSEYDKIIREMKTRYNPNHDSKTGKFTSSSGGGFGGGYGDGGGTGGSAGGGSGGKASSGGGGGQPYTITNDKNIDGAEAKAKAIMGLSKKDLEREIRNNEEIVRSRLGTTAKPFVKEAANIEKVKKEANIDDEHAMEAIAEAEKIYSEAERAEPRITSDVVAASVANGGQMYGLAFRMKQPTSMARKIASDAQDEGKTYQQTASEVKDAVRYTAVFDENTFTDSYRKTKAELESKGYVETRCKNFYTMFNEGRSTQRAVQSVFQDPDGYTFEFQFHTVNSQGAKELNHPMYEMARAKSTSKADQEAYNGKMKEIGTYVREPAGVLTIEEHKRSYGERSVYMNSRDNTQYYATYAEGIPTRVVKIVDLQPYAWIDGEWVYNPRLSKIYTDVTSNFDEITREQAESMIQEYFPAKKK